MKKEKAVLPAPLTNGKDNKSLIDPKQRYIKSKAVAELERLADEAARIKHPNMPFLAPRKYRDDSANKLTACIIDYIRFTGGQAERIANMGRMMDNRRSFVDVTGKLRTVGRNKWIPGTGTNGTADISATISGKSVKIEVKFGRDFQSEAQKKYQKAVELAGGIYFIASSFEQFFKWYHTMFVSNGD